MAFSVERRWWRHCWGVRSGVHHSFGGGRAPPNPRLVSWWFPFWGDGGGGFAGGLELACTTPLGADARRRTRGLFLGGFLFGEMVVEARLCS